MKQFIYLDTDIVNSIIAQKDKGLILQFITEQGNVTDNSKSKTGSLALDGSVGGGIWKFAQAQADLKSSGELTFSDHSQTALKEIETKTLHDAAFDIVYKQIIQDYDLNPKNADLGAYIELNQAFEFVDLEYIENLLSNNNSFIGYLKKHKKKKLNKRQPKASMKI